ncbi:hypothetical protein COB64_01450 [Candidatus Wolfebacteria bacterium]|nr:MAG: hypothetical protein COB64_01450 [Candidatus Wolfebacteria bacterium]
MKISKFTLLWSLAVSICFGLYLMIYYLKYNSIPVSEMGISRAWDVLIGIFWVPYPNLLDKIFTDKNGKKHYNHLFLIVSGTLAIFFGILLDDLFRDDPKMIIEFPIACLMTAGAIEYFQMKSDDYYFMSIFYFGLIFTIASGIVLGLVYVFLGLSIYKLIYPKKDMKLFH